LALLGFVAVLVFVLDRVSKYLVTQNLTLGEPVEVIGQLLQFHYVENPGAAFSLLSGSTWIFALIATTVTVVIILFARRIRSIGWAVMFGLLLGGTVGNLTDRLTREPGFGRGYVVDFLQIWGFPAIFNIADVAIVSAMGLFILLTLRGVGLDGKRAPRPSNGAAGDDQSSTTPSGGDSTTAAT
jgi:signal peptidase II